MTIYEKNFDVVFSIKMMWQFHFRPISHGYKNLELTRPLKPVHIPVADSEQWKIATLDPSIN